MTDIYRISFLKLLRALAEQARNDFADEVFDAESTGERPDLEPAVVEIAVEFAEDISDAIEALQARVLEHDRIVADYLAVIDHLHHEHDYWRGRAEFAEAQFEALAEMAPPPQKWLLLRRLKELAEIRAMKGVGDD